MKQSQAQYKDNKTKKKIKQAIIDHCKELYEGGGQTAVFDYIRVYNKNHIKAIPYEHCKECMTKSPSLEHECLVCGQATQPTGKPKFYQAVLKPIKGDVYSYAYPNQKEGSMTHLERLGDEFAECSECGGNEWMLLAQESVAVKQGGKPYIECLGCGNTTHL